MSAAGVVAISPLSEDAILSPVVRKDDAIMIYLVISGSVVPMRILESDLIESVKLRIQSYKGFVVKNQKLICGGRELSRSNSSVKDYGVKDGNVVHLVVKVSDLQVISVKNSCGKEYNFHVEKNHDVGHVKRQIVRRQLATGKKVVTDIEEQEVWSKEEQVEDERLKNVICKNNDDAVIHLYVRKSAKIRATPMDKNFELTITAPQTNDSKAHDLAVRQLKNEAQGIEYYGLVPKEAAKRSIWLEPVIVNPKVVLPSVLEDLISSAYEGLVKGNHPTRSSEGTGGAYLMMNESGSKYISVFKPIDEEPMAVNNPRGLPLSVDGEGLKKGTTVGEGALREVAAYILDHPKGERRSLSEKHMGFSGVPPTFLATCLHKGFNHPDGVKEKIGSLQMFMENSGSCEDMGPGSFPVEEVHKIAVLDIRMANADRHAGNILVSKGEDGKSVLIPIDHGYCLPSSFEDCTFDWLYWPQSRQPFNPETVEYIESLDADEDIALLNFYGWELPSECACTFRISTLLLKKGVMRGLSPFTIGNIMCRANINKKSVIEEIVQEAEDLVLPCSSEAAFIEAVSEIMDQRLDGYGGGYVSGGYAPTGYGQQGYTNPTSKKSVIEEIVQEAEDLVLPCLSDAADIEAVSEIMDQRLDGYGGGYGQQGYANPTPGYNATSEITTTTNASSGSQVGSTTNQAPPPASGYAVPPTSQAGYEPSGDGGCGPPPTQKPVVSPSYGHLWVWPSNLWKRLSATTYI